MRKWSRISKSAVQVALAEQLSCWHCCSGFVAVITRNKTDVEKFEAGEENPRRDCAWGARSSVRSVKRSQRLRAPCAEREQERQFFASNELFTGVPQRFLGRDALNARLIEVRSSRHSRSSSG